MHDQDDFSGMSFKPPSLSELSFSSNTEQALRQDVVMGRKLAMLARDLHQARLDSREKQSELLDYYTDRTNGYKAGAAYDLQASKKAIEDATTPTGVLLIAVRNVLGPGVGAWDPDTVHSELETHEGLKVPLINYDKMNAGLTLLETPAFYFDADIFKNTVMSLNDVMSDPDVMQEATPEQLCWAIYEAEMILQEHGLFEPEFDREPKIYTAAVLHQAGLELAPPLCAFAQDQLDLLNTNKTEKDKVREEWAKLDKSQLKTHVFIETRTGVQLARLASCSVYVSEKADAYAKALEALAHASG